MVLGYVFNASFREELEVPHEGSKQFVFSSHDFPEHILVEDCKHVRILSEFLGFVGEHEFTSQRRVSAYKVYVYAKSHAELLIKLPLARIKHHLFVLLFVQSYFILVVLVAQKVSFVDLVPDVGHLLFDVSRKGAHSLTLELFLGRKNVSELIEEGGDRGVQLVLHETRSRSQRLLGIVLLGTVLELHEEILQSGVDFDQFLGLVIVLDLSLLDSVQNVHVLRILSIRRLKVLLEERGNFELDLGLAVRELADWVFPHQGIVVLFAQLPIQHDLVLQKRANFFRSQVELFLGHLCQENLQGEGSTQDFVFHHFVQKLLVKDLHLLQLGLLVSLIVEVHERRQGNEGELQREDLIEPFEIRLESNDLESL